MCSANNNLYKDKLARIDTIIGEDGHLHKLKQIADAYQMFGMENGLSVRDRMDSGAFAEWLLARWGVDLLVDRSETGGIKGYVVADEKKYLLFCMVFA